MSGDHNPRKFIIDTDPGVDDAMAIFMALEAHRRGDIEILAFTLVTGNCHVDYQPTNMLRILKLVPEIYGQVRAFHRFGRAKLVHNGLYLGLSQFSILGAQKKYADCE